MGHVAVYRIVGRSNTHPVLLTPPLAALTTTLRAFGRALEMGGESAITLIVEFPTTAQEFRAAVVLAVTCWKARFWRTREQSSLASNLKVLEYTYVRHTALRHRYTVIER